MKTMQLPLAANLFYDLFSQGRGGGHGPLASPSGFATEVPSCLTHVYEIWII